MNVDCAGAGYFVTGTDTGVGKTLVACALLRSFARQGRRVVGVKPVAAGRASSAGRWGNDDVAALAAASSIPVTREQINPYLFTPPIAPHIAAAEAGIHVDLAVLEASVARLRAVADLVIVEGVGGFLVPLNEREDASDLAVRLALPVVVVVGLRLGCLNHALLTARAVKDRGLILAGWVANRVDPGMARATENRTALEDRLGAPLLGEIPFMHEPEVALAAASLDVRMLAGARQ
jgi:dethiobiotin synthetase